MNGLAIWHSVIEATIAFLCFVNAALAWDRYREVSLGLNALWCVAMVTAGVLISLHAALSFASPALVTYWVPWTWAVAHATLAVLLFAGVRFADRQGKQVWLPAVALAVAFSVGLFPWGERFSFVYTESLVKRPLDLTLMFMWAGLLVVFVRSPTRLQLPGGVTHFFLALGVLSHGVMAFGSAASLDAGFMIAHVLKLLEVGAWTVCAITECCGARVANQSMAEVYQRRVGSWAGRIPPDCLESSGELGSLRDEVKKHAAQIRDRRPSKQ